MTITMTSAIAPTIFPTSFKCFGSTCLPHLFVGSNMPYFGADNINFAPLEAKPFIAGGNGACYISCDMARPQLSTVQLLAVTGLVGSAIALGLAATHLPGKPSAITWERDYAKAIQRAQSEKK